MYIKRKVFSAMVDKKTGKEKLFSTTEIEKDFSDKKKDKEDDLTTSDKFNLWAAKHMRTKEGRKVTEQAIDKDEWKPFIKHNAKRGAQVGGVIGGAMGAAAGASNGGIKGALKGAAAGSATGAAILAGNSALTAALQAKALKDARRRKSSNKYMEEAKEGSDLYKVADGKMTKKEFINKHYNKK